jgi:hypothetical protein
MRFHVAILILVMTVAGCSDRKPAANEAPARTGPRTAFSGDSALAYVGAAMAFGFRIPGTDAHRQAGDWIVARMRERADTVVVQEWTHTSAAGVALPMRNVLARYRLEAAERVLFVTHWDTRPRSESAARPEDRTRPVPGANDGTSGVGLFLALGDVLKKTPPSVGVDLLFVDGEDYGDFPTNTDVLIGSTYFAEHLPSADYRPTFGVLWDMIGDRDLRIPYEQNSLDGAPSVVARVWQTAADLGYGHIFVQESRPAITDDHVPLLRKGLPVIDVIDIDYGPPAQTWHHTPEDTIDKISAASLQAVGDVAVTLVK